VRGRRFLGTPRGFGRPQSRLLLAVYQMVAPALSASSVIVNLHRVLCRCRVGGASEIGFVRNSRTSIVYHVICSAS
jgi:hypothetical protein